MEKVIDHLPDPLLHNPLPKFIPLRHPDAFALRESTLVQLGVMVSDGMQPPMRLNPYPSASADFGRLAPLIGRSFSSALHELLGSWSQCAPGFGIGGLWRKGVTHSAPGSPAAELVPGRTMRWGAPLPR